MAQAPATSRLKINPPLGRLPVLQFVAPGELEIDPTYQRSIEGSDSQTLIRRLAMHWNWDLCLPLVVSRRRSDEGEKLFVIDGQHRLSAAIARGDITQLPCMVKEYSSAADEAASFVHLNQQRRPLSKIDLFKAAVASEDPQAIAILDAIEAAGLSIAPHQTSVAWKPGMIGNIGGIEFAWRAHGEKAVRLALQVLADAFAGQVLRYAGTIFPGVVAVCAGEIDAFAAEVRVSIFKRMLGDRSQTQWRADIMRARSDDPNLKFARASAKVIKAAWEKRYGFFAQGGTAARPTVKTVSQKVDEGAFTVSPTDDSSAPPRAWCSQCERRVTREKAAACLSQFCKLKA